MRGADVEASGRMSAEDQTGGATEGPPRGLKQETRRAESKEVGRAVGLPSWISA